MPVNIMTESKMTNRFKTLFFIMIEGAQRCVGILFSSY